LIFVRCVGHIGTSVGREEFQVDAEGLSLGELVEMVRGMCKEPEPGFDRFNTIAMVEEGEAFVAAASVERLRAGQKVVLIPFSHGG